jgi:hypothetical protein
MAAPALACLGCGAKLENALEKLENDLTNLPIGGTIFTSHGNYGSTAFDPTDGSYLVINICDACLFQGQFEGRVLFAKRQVPLPPPALSLWDGYAPEEPSNGEEAELNNLQEIDSVFAPWSIDQVASLNAYQASGHFHPFTCDRGAHVLVATPQGWICPQDDYTQAWAHDFMLDWSWRDLTPRW